MELPAGVDCTITKIFREIFSLQSLLKANAPEFAWNGLGNLLGDFGEWIALNHYQLKKAPTGSNGFDALTHDAKKVQIKTNRSSATIGFRGRADYLLVIGIREDASWFEIFNGPFSKVESKCRPSSRDNKLSIAIRELDRLAPLVKSEEKILRSIG